MRNFLTLTLTIALAGSVSSAANADSPGGGLKKHKFGPHTLFGTIVSFTAANLTLHRRNGKVIVVDISDAVLSSQIGILYVGRPVALHGDFEPPNHVYKVDSITSANGILFGSDPPDQ